MNYRASNIPNFTGLLQLANQGNQQILDSFKGLGNIAKNQHKQNELDFNKSIQQQLLQNPQNNELVDNLINSEDFDRFNSDTLSALQNQRKNIKEKETANFNKQLLIESLVNPNSVDSLLQTAIFNPDKVSTKSLTKIANLKNKQDQKKLFNSLLGLNGSNRNQTDLNNVPDTNISELTDYDRSIGQTESNNDYQAIFKASNGNNAIGKGQFIADRIQDIAVNGNLDKNTSKLLKDGLVKKGNSYRFTKEFENSFRNNPELQDKVYAAHKDLAVKRIPKSVIDQIGTKIDGIEITPDGLLAVAHLGGEGGLKQFVDSKGNYNPADGLGTALKDYLSRHAGYSEASRFGLSVPNQQSTGISNNLMDLNQFNKQVDLAVLNNGITAEQAKLVKDNAKEQYNVQLENIANSATSKDQLRSFAKQNNFSSNQTKALLNKFSDELVTGNRNQVKQEANLNLDNDLAQLVNTTDEAVSSAKDAFKLSESGKYYDAVNNRAKYIKEKGNRTLTEIGDALAKTSAAEKDTFFFEDDSSNLQVKITEIKDDLKNEDMFKDVDIPNELIAELYQNAKPRELFGGLSNTSLLGTGSVLKRVKDELRRIYDPKNQKETREVKTKYDVNIQKMDKLVNQKNKIQDQYLIEMGRGNSSKAKTLRNKLVDTSNKILQLERDIEKLVNTRKKDNNQVTQRLSRKQARTGRP